MKKLITAAILVLTSVVITHSEPRLVVPAPVFDFGFTPQGAMVVHRFWFKSVGTDTLKINEIKTGCSCALMPLDRDWIAPGDSMEVSIHWDLKRSLGGVVRFPRVFTNVEPDPIKLQLTGTVLAYPDSARPVSIRPYRFELSRSSRKDIDSLTFTLTNHSRQDLAIKLISARPEEYELILPDSAHALSSSTGYVKLKPEFVDSEFQTSLTLLISDQGNTHLTIPVRRKFYTVKEK